MTIRETSRLDPVTFEVLKNAFVNLVDQMAEVIFRTCYSFVIYVRDFSACLCDAKGDTVAQGTQDIAVHVGTLHFTAKACLNEYGRENLYPGDAIVFNDPFMGGTHFCDVRVVRPVFYKDDLIAFTVVNGHWSDVGGSVPGSFDIEATECFREGLRITPVKIVDQGKYNHQLAKFICSNMRVSWEREGDLRAQVEASRIGAEYLVSLCDKYGKETILSAFEECMDYVERMTRAEIAKLPNGVFEADDFMDKDPGRSPDNLVRVHVALEIKDDELVYDLEGTDPVVDCFLNSTFSSSYSAAITATKMALPQVPLNSGFYRAVKMNLPEGCCANAKEPSPVAGFCTGSYEKIVNASFWCWAQVLPQRGVGSSFNLEYLLMGGWDERPGYNQPFIYYDWLSGGWGGRYGKDGPPPLCPVFGAGLTNHPVEANERLNPILVEKYNILADSAGPGKWRGGMGIEKMYRVYQSRKIILSYCCDRERALAQGVFGGAPGIPHGVVVNKGTSQEEYWGVVFAGHKLPNDVTIWRCSSGGGGYGDPLERNLELVLQDLKNEYVTLEGAKKDYGVIAKCIDKEIAQYEIDLEATKREREYRRQVRKECLEEDPEKVLHLLLEGKINHTDAARHYGVLIDRSTMQVLPNSTKTFRKTLKTRCAAYWK